MGRLQVGSGLTACGLYGLLEILFAEQIRVYSGKIEVWKNGIDWALKIFGRLFLLTGQGFPG